MPKGIYKRRHTKSLEDRFWAKVDKRGSDECWEWIGSIKHTSGYGQLNAFGSRSALAHRVSYQLNVGPIPEGMQVLHACDNRPCVNPAHLHLGTHADNMREMSQRRRAAKSGVTHCPAGHPYAEFARVVHRGNGKPFRQCIPCNREAGRRYNARMRAA